MPIDTSGLTRAFQRLGDQFEYKDPVYRAVIIADDDNNNWTVDFLNPDGTRGSRRSVKGTGNYWPGLIVRISRDRKRWGPDYWVIIDADVSGYGVDAPDPTLPLHGWMHGFYQPDETTNLATFQIYALRVQPADPEDDTVNVEPGIYYAGSAFHYLSVETNVDLAAYIAALGAGQRQYLVLSIDDTETINVTQGTPKVGVLVASDIPTPPLDERALCAVDIRVGDTAITRDRVYADLRWLAGGVPVDGMFLDLTDTPATYVGQADLVPAVNGGETALEFVDVVRADDFAAKGDLQVGTAAGTFTDRTVGVDGQVLTADSGEADGVKWDDIATAYAIVLFSGDATDYAVTDVGMAAAIAAAGAGDTISVPPVTLTNDYAIPAGVTVRGVSITDTVFSGQITLNAESAIEHLSVVRSKNDGADYYGVIGPNSDTGYIKYCWISVTQAGGGTGYGVSVSGRDGDLEVYGGRVYGSTADAEEN